MEFFQSYQKGQEQQRLKQFEEAKMQQQERAMRQEQTIGGLAQQYMRDPNPQTISQIAAFSPEKAQGLMKVQQQVMQNKARSIKSFANTFNNMSESQIADAYPELIKKYQRQGVDTRNMPPEYNKDTAQQIKDVIKSESQKADRFLGLENIEYGKVPEGHYLEKETKELRPMVGYQPEKSIRIPKEVQNDPSKFQDVESIANQNLLTGNQKLAKQQFALADRLRKENELIQKDTLKLSERFEKSDVGGLIDSIDRLARFASEAEDIPGAGKTGGVSPILLSQKGKDVRQSVLTFANQLVKAQSGLQINESEAARIFGELGIERNQATGKVTLIPTTTDEQLRTGLRNAISRIRAKVKTIQSGARPKALQRFNERAGVDYFDALGTINVKDFRQPQEPTQQEAGQAQEGTIIENEETGEELIFKGGQWQKQ